jgi:inosose dehydratase
MKVDIGTAPDNWGVWFPSDPKQIPWERYLDECAEAGYDITELGPFGYFPTDPDVLGKELEKRHLRLEAGFTFQDFSNPEKWPDMEAETIGACEVASAFGAKYHMLIGLPYTDLFTGKQLQPANLDEDGWKRFIDHTNRCAEIVRDRFGMKSVLHPHTDTHVQNTEQMERYLEDTDTDLVDVCLDTGHHAYCDGDPVEFMRKWHHRIPYLHIKSVDLEVRDEIRREGISFAKAVEIDMFCELSCGVVDFRVFAEVLKEVDYNGVAIVEQDMYPCPFDKPMPIAKRNRDFLREIGIG